MIQLIFSAFAYAENIKILFNDNTDLRLSIITTPSLGQKVRLLRENKISDEGVTSTFFIEDFPTKLDTPEGYICGKPNDPGVVVCKDQKANSKFEFEKTNNYVKIKSEEGKCLTKRGLDSASGGYYLNLSKCEDIPEQKFIISPVVLLTKTASDPDTKAYSYQHFDFAYPKITTFDYKPSRSNYTDSRYYRYGNYSTWPQGHVSARYGHRRYMYY